MGEVTCPACGEPGAADDRYCEACGAPHAGDPPTTSASSPGSPCPACGGTIADDGYCGTCGARAPSERDHWVMRPASWVAGVCDRGIRHATNEDAMAVAADPDPGGVAVLVVCDGVSSTPGSDVASLAAASAARDALRSPNGTGVVIAAGPAAATPPDGGGDERAAAWGDALCQATAAAQEVVAATAEAAVLSDSGRAGGHPSCTLAAAVVDGSLIVTACVGDSRVYWAGEGGAAVQLTTDDSWAAARMADGVPRIEAESGPHAHAITRWLGRDSPDPTPSLVTMTAEGPGWVVVCSDGLWNYCSEPAELAAVLREVGQHTGADPAELAAGLVAWANDMGGHDNISVALARIGGAGTGDGERPEGATNADG